MDLLFTPDIQGKNFVLRGQFSPTVFHPSWFSKHELMRPEELEEASVEIISPRLTHLRTEWLQLQATPDRLLLSTPDAAFFEVLRDLVVGLIEVLVDALPIRLLGMNHNFHFRVDTEEQWHHVGHTLAPKEPWQPLSTVLGLKTISIEGQRQDDLSGSVNAKVEPSSKYNREQNDYGIYIELNDHIELSGEEVTPVPESAMRAVEIISNYWDDSVIRANAVANGIMRLAYEEELT